MSTPGEMQTDYSGRGVLFWFNLKVTSVMFPYIRRELDRKYNWNTKIRKLRDDDIDLLEDLTGKVCVMTGGNRGIGAEVVKVLLKKNCHIITTSSSKNPADHKKAYDAIRADVPEPMGKLEIWHLDLRVMKSVIEFTDKFKDTKLPINYLIANAGLFDQIIKTKDGFEKTFQVNYLSHCLLIDRLIDKMHETAKHTNTESRIVLVSSCVHRVGRIKFEDLMLENSKSVIFAYGQSKLAMIMFAISLDRYLIEKGDDWSKRITINSLHPGMCDTEIMFRMPFVEEVRPLLARAFRTSKEGAETIIYTAISTQMDGISGKYLEDCAIEQPSFEATVKADQNQLWKTTWQLLAKWTQRSWN